eukprot:3795014-Amphidinium_carterae.1
MSGPLYLEYISDEELDDVVFMETEHRHSATAAASSTVAVVKNERDGNQDDEKASEFETTLERELESLLEGEGGDTDNE